ncbi:MAG: hypothetical protein J6I70_02605 [Bacteroidaceae bacterium]|nr:hypothetical protein [Bacteroidaceae bacterium]
MSRFGNIDSTWFEQRSKIYAQLAKGLPMEADNVKFRFNPPKYGSIDMYILVENKVNMMIPIAVHRFSFSMLRTFLENIVKDDLSLESCIYLNTDMDKITDVFHYEHLVHKPCNLLCPMGLNNKYADECEADDDYGLFYIYNWRCNEPIYAFCKTRDFVKSLYLSVLSYIGLGNNDFYEEWYRYEGGDDEGKWKLYNEFKSDLIEWYIYSDKSYREVWPRPKFKNEHAVDEIIMMYPGYFMDDNGEEFGDCDTIPLWDDEIEIDYATNNLLLDWAWGIFDEIYTEEIFQKGWRAAKRLRKLLPNNVDLFYTCWDPYHPERLLGCEGDYPRLIVPRS